MRRIIAFYLIFLNIYAAYGVARNDSVRVYFALNRATYDAAIDNNGASMDEFIDSIVVAANSGMLDKIAVYGYASPDGPFRVNDKLAIRRCKEIADYISRRAGIPMDDIRMSPGGVAWDVLRALVVEDTTTPSRNAVIRILDEYLPDACTNRVKSDRCMKSLVAIDGGVTYEWLLKNLFSRLRFSLAVYTSPVSDASDLLPIVDDIAADTDAYANADTESDVPRVYIEDFDADNVPPPISDSYRAECDTTAGDLTPVPYAPLHRLAVKTNLLYDAALWPNLEVEWRINNDWSVALEGGIAWWGHYSNQHSYRLVMISPEVKRWIHPRAPWHGLYVGLFAGGGYYDLAKSIRGYRGEGGMGGVSVGYMWPISKCLSLEAAIGGGYLYTRYKEYKFMDGCHVYQRTKDINYFGPLKVKLSFVWRLWNQNKSQRANLIMEQYEK